MSILIISPLFVIIDLIPLYRKKEWAGFFLFGIMLVFSIVLAVIMDLRVDVPSPAEPIKRIITFIVGPVDQ